MRIVTAFIIGIIFGLGIALSGMANPAKVLNFFDFALVMGGALITTAIGYRCVFGARKEPLLESAFSLPANRTVDARLLAGSALFGIGWGVTGFCPGGAIPAMGLGYGSTFLFVGAMIAGIALTRTIINTRVRPARA